MILVTGPNGFVGEQLCCELISRGREVLGAQFHKASLPQGCCSVMIGNIGPETDWSKVLCGVDTVVHLAARVHVMKDTVVDPMAEFRKVNVEGTRRLAESSAEAKVKRFVFLSSIKVNGEMTDDIGGPFKETDVPAPEDAYGISKWEAEQVLRIIEQETGMEVVIIRSPLVYGPGVKANFLNLLKLIERGIPLPFGSIHNQRSLVGLTNLVDAVCLCIDHPKAAGEIFLVSDGDDVSTPELVRRIALALGKPARLLPISNWILKLAGKATGTSDQINRLCGSLQADSSKIQKILGWLPPRSMNKELARVAKWYNDSIWRKEYL